MSCIKYLGIFIDSTLSWKPQVTELSKKRARNCGNFFKIRHYVNPDTLKLLYYSFFYSFLSYGTIVWGLTHPSAILPLHKLQKKDIRAICFKDRLAHTSLLFHKLETLKLFDIHSLQLLCFVFDCTKEQPLFHLQIFFVPVHSVHQHFTRQVAKQNIYVQNVHTTQYGIRSARYTGTILWNNLTMVH